MDKQCDCNLYGGCPKCRITPPTDEGLILKVKEFLASVCLGDMNWDDEANELIKIIQPYLQQVIARDYVTKKELERQLIMVEETSRRVGWQMGITSQKQVGGKQNG